MPCPDLGCVRERSFPTSAPPPHQRKPLTLKLNALRLAFDRGDGCCSSNRGKYDIEGRGSSRAVEFGSGQWHDLGDEVEGGRATYTGEEGGTDEEETVEKVKRKVRSAGGNSQISPFPLPRRGRCQAISHHL